MKRRTSTVLWILALACAPAVLLAGDEDPLAGTSDAWIEAYNNGDAAAIAAMNTEDAMLLPPNAEPIHGREAIEGFWAAAIATGVKGSLEVVESEVDGDLGYKIGTYELHDAEGEVVDHGKFLEIWKKVDGQWLMHRDIYNSSAQVMPEQAPAEE